MEVRKSALAALALSLPARRGMGDPYPRIRAAFSGKVEKPATGISQ